MTRPVASAVAVTLLTLAGCLAGEDDAPPGDGPAPPAGLAYAPDCGVAIANATWPEPCVVFASPNPSPSKAEIDIAVNPTDPLNVFVASKDLDPAASECVWSVGQVSKDGGRTWTTVYVGGTVAERDPAGPAWGWGCVTDPIMVFDDGGYLYYPLQAYNYDPSCFTPAGCAIGAGLPDDPVTSGSSFLLARSIDGGETFGHIIVMAAAEGNVVFHDYPRMAYSAATGSVHTVWNAVGFGGVNPYVVTTRDRGETVDRPTVVAFPDSPRTTYFASGFAADGEGVLYMTVGKFDVTGVFGGGGGETVQGYVAVSRDDGRSFGEFLPAFEVYPYGGLDNVEFRAGTRVELVIDTSGGGHDGRIYAVFDDIRSGDVDVWVAWSDDGAASWSEPVRVNADNTTTDQWMPRATVGPDGTVHILYFDRSHDPANRLIDATYAYSDDGGATWANQRLTATSFDGDLGVHQNGFPFIGDYNGITAAGDRVYVGFPTTVTGVAEIAVGVITRPQ